MIITAFLLGFLGSLHCIGMCGPLALALPIPNDKRIFGITLYNIGRIFTYSVFGLVLGFVGSNIFISGFQKIFALAAGFIIILFVLVPSLSRFFTRSYQQSAFMVRIKAEISKRFQERSLTTSLIVGILNGFLPCGLVYVALAGALATGEILSGSLFMASFGMGTLPTMLSLSIIPRLFQYKFQSKWIVTGMSLIIASLFLYRGFGIELPVIDQLLLKTGLNNIAVCF